MKVEIKVTGITESIKLTLGIETESGEETSKEIDYKVQDDSKEARIEEVESNSEEESEDAKVEKAVEETSNELVLEEAESNSEEESEDAKVEEEVEETSNKPALEEAESKSEEDSEDAKVEEELEKNSRKKVSKKKAHPRRKNSRSKTLDGVELKPEAIDIINASSSREDLVKKIAKYAVIAISRLDALSGIINFFLENPELELTPRWSEIRAHSRYPITDYDQLNISTQIRRTLDQNVLQFCFSVAQAYRETEAYREEKNNAEVKEEEIPAAELEGTHESNELSDELQEEDLVGAYKSIFSTLPYLSEENEETKAIKLREEEIRAVNEQSTILTDEIEERLRKIITILNPSHEDEEIVNPDMLDFVIECYEEHENNPNWVLDPNELIFQRKLKYMEFTKFLMKVYDTYFSCAATATKQERPTPNEFMIDLFNFVEGR